MRDLPTDNVIILVNGKRRHRSASIALSGSALNKGAQGPDLNMIPTIALRQLEILRDGATAQYGADAVAGVQPAIAGRSTGGALFYGRGSIREETDAISTWQRMRNSPCPGTGF